MGGPIARLVSRSLFRRCDLAMDQPFLDGSDCLGLDVDNVPHWAMSGKNKCKVEDLLWQWLSLVFPVDCHSHSSWFKYFVWEYLTLRGTALYIVNFCADVVFLLGVLVLIVRVSSRIAETLVALPKCFPKRTGCQLDSNYLPGAWHRRSGDRVSRRRSLPGLSADDAHRQCRDRGLGHRTFAQGLIKGLFGTVTVLLDKPYRVGERIVVKGHDGFVEEIGLRSTKIRALDNRLISIPNDLMSESEIENIGGHNHIRRITNLHIPLDTPREQVEKALRCIREVLENHEGMVPELPPRVRFTDFNPDSFNVRVTFWFTPPDLAKFHEFSEKVNLEIMRAFEEHGIQFSLPFRHTYWKTRRSTRTARCRN